MENKVPGPSKGYQKQIKKEAQPQPKPKVSHSADYSSPLAKKWPLFVEALERGNADEVKKLIEEGINVNIMRDGVTPLMIAASKGKTEIAEAILQAGANINEKTDDGWTALHKAVHDQTATDIVNLLMGSGIDIEAKDKSGKSALQIAGEKGHRDIVRLIRKHQAQVQADAQEWEGFLSSPEGRPYQQQRRYDTLTRYSGFWWVPTLLLGGVGLLAGFLLRAVLLSGLIGIVAGLLAGFSVQLFEKKLRRYLDDIGPLPYLDIHTLRQKRKAGEPILVGKNAETPPSPEGTPVAQSADAAPEAAGNPALLEEMPIEESSGTEAPQFMVWGSRTVVASAVVALIIVILFGVLFIYKGSLLKWYYAKKLENRGILFSEQAFLDEVSKNNEEAVDFFVKAGMPLDAKNEKGQTALIIASEKGYVNILGKLVKLNPTLLSQTDKSGNTALMTAARKGHENIVRLLVESGSDVNYTVPADEGAASALQAALDASDSKEEHLGIVKFLLQRGAQVKGKNTAGRFPLLFAAEHGRTEAANLLIENGADVNDADGKGNFSLLAAACKGHAGLVALLAEKGANMQTTSPDGQTPLMCAAREGHVDAVKALIEKGANVNAKTASGATALTDAARSGQVDVAKVLLAYGADPGSGYLPDSFAAFIGKTIIVNAKKSKSGDVLRRIATTASQDGYTINFDPGMAQKTTLAAKAPWNKVLNELATKNRLLLVVKEKEIFVLPYGK